MGSEVSEAGQWPHLVEAKVVAVQSSKVYIDTRCRGRWMRRKKDNELMAGLSQSWVRTQKTQYSSRYGVEVGDWGG